MIGPRTLRLIRSAVVGLRRAAKTPMASRRSSCAPVSGCDCTARPASANPAPALLWIHGGGYVMGTAKQDDRLCRRFARELGVTVAAVDYRLAPEHPYPAPLEDCYAALTWLAALPAVDPARVAIGGASAGGGLTAALALLARDRGEVTPTLQLLAYPMLDDRSASGPENPNYRLWSPKSNRFGWAAYLGNADPNIAVPARHEDLSGLPPAWIGVGTNDLFHDEDLAYAERLTAAGVPCQVEVVPGAFPRLRRDSAESRCVTVVFRQPVREPAIRAGRDELMPTGAPFSVSDEQRALRSAVADLMARHSSEAQVRTLMATDTGFDPAVWRELAAMGLTGLLIDEEHGGAGAGPVEMGIAMEEMGRTLLVGPFLSTAVLVPSLLAATGDAAECGAVLPRIAAGELIATVAFAEDGSARLPATIATSAGQIGDTWHVTGYKHFVLDGQSAELLYVLAATDAGPAVFAVDAGAPGLAVTPLTTVDPTRKQCRLQFVDTPARLIGRPGAGVEVFNAALDACALALVSEQAGGARRAVEMATEYAKTRYQFGRAIGSFQAVKHMCADMLLEAESTVSAARFVANSFAEHAPSRIADLALAQAYCSDAFVFVAATSIQVHGGIGFTWEHPAHLYLRRARSDAQLLGSPSWHRERYLQQIGA